MFHPQTIAKRVSKPEFPFMLVILSIWKHACPTMGCNSYGTTAENWDDENYFNQDLYQNGVVDVFVIVGGGESEV